MTVRRHVMPSGYVRVWEPTHPLANRDGYVLEHRKVMYDAGHHPLPGQHIHHLNGDKQDNRLENLTVKAAGDHVRDHAVERGFVENQSGIHPLRQPKECERCGKPFMPWKPNGRFCSRLCANQRGGWLGSLGLRLSAPGPTRYW